MHYFVSILVLQSSLRGREILLFCCYCLTDVLLLLCSVALPHGAVGWSAVFDCGISRPYWLCFLHAIYRWWPKLFVTFFLPLRLNL